jgi:hypothetical protein
MKQGTNSLKYFTISDTFCCNKCKCIFDIIIFSITYSKISLCIKHCIPANSPQETVFVLCAWQTIEMLYLWLYSPFFGPLPLFLFLNHIQSWYTPWMGDQPITRPLLTHRINTHRHPCLQWDSNPRSQCSIQ